MRGLQVIFLNIPFRKTEEIILRLAPKLDIVNKDFLSPVFAVSSESDAQGINPSYIHHHAINLEPNFILVKIIAHDPGTFGYPGIAIIIIIIIIWARWFIIWARWSLPLGSFFPFQTSALSRCSIAARPLKEKVGLVSKILRKVKEIEFELGVAGNVNFFHCIRH